jgi:adenine specific DNA methylase Mod
MTIQVFPTNTLFYGDNLEVLQRHFPPECIDLIYLDPPFNSKVDYNILFRERSGKESVAQAQAFSDSWTWDIAAEKTYMGIQKDPNLGNMITFLHGYLGKNDMMAYLVMMAIRLKELHRVLKPTGSIYLHCDSTASHYLKIIMDVIFGVENFRNEIIWKRQTAHSDALRFGRVADRIFFYSKTDEYKFYRQSKGRGEDYLKSHFSHVDKDGRLFRLSDLNPPGGRGPVYQFHGLTRPWRFTQEKMLELEGKGPDLYTIQGSSAHKIFG